MLISSLMASFHYLAIAMGFGGLFMRGRYLKALATQPHDELNVRRLFIADNFWGIAALVWIATGLARAFGGLEKGTVYYLNSSLFYVKMGLFLAVFIMEIIPMIGLIRLRIRRRTDNKASLTPENFKKYRAINHTEAILILLMVFVASAMARGLW